MKECHLKIFFCICLLGTLLSCSVEPIPSICVRESSSTCYSSNKVSLTEAYEMATIQTKGDAKYVTVEPIIDVEGDTLMYFVNYQEGWKILSADKRTPVLIAQSDVGAVSLNTDNDGFIGWLEMTALDMKRIIHSDDKELNFTEWEVLSHKQEWSRESPSQPLRSPRDSLPILPNYDGEWELHSTTTSEVYYDHLDHLMDSQWHQDSPYNGYCPQKTSGSGNMPAGCTPVACGQLLRYLCTKFGVDFYFGWNGVYSNIDETTSVPRETDTAPLLLRYLGSELKATYGNSSTSVLFAANKIKNFYANHRISCTKQSYSADKVKDNLIDSLAILVSGYSGTILGVPDYTNGHTYIIDGYRRTRTQTLKYYTRLTGGYPPILEERTDTTYSSPRITSIKMNWGWASQWDSQNNDGWYALTGDWYFGSDDESYTEDITILCDFTFDYLLD